MTKEQHFEAMYVAYQTYRKVVERAKEAGVIIAYTPPAVVEPDGTVIYPKRFS